MLTTLTSRPTTIVESVMPFARISLAICSKPACASAGLPSVMNITCLRFVPSNALSVSEARRSAPVNRVNLLGSAVSMLLIASSTGFLSPIAVISTSICASSENVMTPA